VSIHSQRKNSEKVLKNATEMAVAMSPVMKSRTYYLRLMDSHLLKRKLKVSCLREKAMRINLGIFIVFMEEFDTNHDGRISWEEFKAALERMKQRVNEKAYRAKEYTSFNKLKEDRFKHKRMNVELQDKYKVPVTFNQTVGFYNKDEISKDIAK
jgi:hypothetical protein